MPFWEKVRRCENCRRWHQKDISDPSGTCVFQPERAPFWHEAKPTITRFDEGTTCPAYEHGKHKPHPLDGARAYLAHAQVGDLLPMRTYGISESVSHAHAEVLKHNRLFVTVRMFNGYYRIRRDAADRVRGGTVIGMERWGVDTSAKITRAGVAKEHPERAEGMLRKVRRGDKLKVIGYPPLDGQRKDAMVLTLTAGVLTLRIGRRRVRMYRKGPLAGITINDVWVLDTTEETNHAGEAVDVEGKDTPAEGHQT